MTPQQMVGLAVRLFAIWLAITAMQAFGLARAMAAQPGAEATAVPDVVAAVLAIVAVLLWLFPMVVAHSLIPRTQFDDALRVPAREALVVACVVLGLWVFVTRAVPAIGYYVSYAAIWIKNGQSIATMDQSQHISFALGLVYLAVTWLLVLKASRLTAYIFSKHLNDQAN